MAANPGLVLATTLTQGPPPPMEPMLGQPLLDAELPHPQFARDLPP